jgi:transcriptional regulator with XRE-family HTH domain
VDKDYGLEKRQFGERLAQLRLSKQLTQARLAEMAGLPPAAISHFETGFRLPAPQSLQKLADALGVTVDALLGRTAAIEPSGPKAEALFRHFSSLSDQSQEQILEMAKLLQKLDEERKRRG